jgi:VanZ family protein
MRASGARGQHKAGLVLRKLYVAIGWALVAAIVVVSVIPSPPSIDIKEGDKLGHLLAYGGAMLWFSLLYPDWRTRVRYALGFIAMGIALEFVQGWLGYRSFEVLDMLANSAGVLLGLGAALWLPRKLLP